MTSTTLLSKTAQHVDADDNDSRWPDEIKSKLLAEFFFDVDKIVGFNVTRSKWMACFMSFIPIYGCVAFGPIFCANACTIRKNMTEKAGSMRVGITPEEMIFMTGSFGGLCRCNCQRTGARSVIVPLNRITDIVIEMPAGGCLPPNVLTKCHVQTAGQGALGSSEILLEGLVDADHFRRTILALRHGDPLPVGDAKAARLYRQPDASAAPIKPIAADAAASPAAFETSPLGNDRVVASSDAQIETVALLKEVNKNLVTMCHLLQQQQQR